MTRATGSVFCTSSASSTAPVTAAGSAGHVGALAAFTSTTRPVTGLASSPASGEAPACQQMPSSSWLSGSPMSARNLSATGKGSRRTSRQPALRKEVSAYSAAALSEAVPPIRGPICSESTRRSRSARAGLMRRTTWLSR
ncbi:hypothetical protein [Nocardioides sp. P5_E3]